MSYIRKIAIAEEKVLVITRVHPIYAIEGLIWFIILTFLGLLLESKLIGYGVSTAWRFDFSLYGIDFRAGLNPLLWGFGVTGFLIFWIYLLKYISNEIGLTDQRIIHKKGLLFVEVLQIDLEDIRGEYVIHGWLGWIFGYGRIHLDCRFIEDVYLPAIARPYRFVKQSHYARMKHPLIDYTEKELQLNTQEIERCKKEAAAKMKLRILKDLIKGNFKRAS